MEVLNCHHICEITWTVQRILFKQYNTQYWSNYQTKSLKWHTNNFLEKSVDHIWQRLDKQSRSWLSWLKLSFRGVRKGALFVLSKKFHIGNVDIVLRRQYWECDLMIQTILSILETFCQKGPRDLTSHQKYHYIRTAGVTEVYNRERERSLPTTLRLNLRLRTGVVEI